MSSSVKAFIGNSEASEYDEFHKTVEVQVFPQNLRVTWDDTGCALTMAVLLVTAVLGLISSGLYYRSIIANEAGVTLSETWALFTETGMLICALFCSGIVLCFCFMCLCGLKTQLMAARSRHFGSLRKNRILLSLMRGVSAWDDPDFQRLLRQQDRRMERIKTTVEARMEGWLAQRAARVQYMLAMRRQLAKLRTRNKLEASKSSQQVAASYQWSIQWMGQTDVSQSCCIVPRKRCQVAWG